MQRPTAKMSRKSPIDLVLHKGFVISLMLYHYSNHPWTSIVSNTIQIQHIFYDEIGLSIMPPSY